MPRIQRALISVSDKSGLIDFARALRSFTVEIISTGGTLSTLRDHGIEAEPVSAFTGFPEILDGRVKTLHPRIHGAILGVPDNEAHRRQMAEHDISPIDMVVVNLYPFERTIARQDVLLEEAIEQIDIGGPAMIRSAAKNYRHKAVIVSPARYAPIIEEMHSHNGEITEATRAALAREAFHHTSAYDAVIADYLERTGGEAACLPTELLIHARKEIDLRYGENPHQRAALYGNFGSHFRKLHGKELSYNNIVDISAAGALVAEFDEPTVAIVKHTNPCGVGSAPTLVEAYRKAFATDVKSPYGGIVAVNKPLDLEAAQAISEIFTEVIIAPEIPDAVLDFLEKKKDRRIIQMMPGKPDGMEILIRSVPGGFLAQEPDSRPVDSEQFRIATRRQPTEREWRGLRFGWRVAKHVKSNAIVYASEDRTLGVGAGQMSRIDSVHMAAEKATGAGLSLKGSVVASDAFFPFADALLEAIQAGSTAVIQPGGSIRDNEVIATADDHGLAMVFTGVRHFRH